MRIPTPSDVLVVGVSPVSLAFAAILAKGGLNVLVVDEAEQQIAKEEQKLILSDYSLGLLEQHGFKISPEITSYDFIEQSLTLLAHNLCCVIWGTTFLGSAGKEIQLLQAGATQLHHTDFIFKQDDIIIDTGNDEANFRTAFVLAWRVIGVKLKKFNPFILNSFSDEKGLIAEFYRRGSGTSFLSKWFIKLDPSKTNSLTLTESPINLHLSQFRNIQAGEILPDLPFFDEKLEQPSSLHQWSSYQRFSMIIFGTLNPQFLFSLAKWVQLNFNIKLFYLPYSERNDAFFKSLNMAPSEKRTLIIRPDRYISLISDTVETDIIDNYLRNVLMMNANAEKD